MGIEIERKFLLASGSWRREAGTGVTMKQGYFETTLNGPTVRVRLAGEIAWLTIKGQAENFARSEFEYPIPPADAEAMLQEFCGSRIVEKCRYRLPSPEGLTWEIDEFTGLNAGLFLAEIELPTPDTPFALPPWLGPEVSHDPRYTNGSLARLPYSLW